MITSNNKLLESNFQYNRTSNNQFYQRRQLCVSHADISMRAVVKYFSSFNFQACFCRKALLQLLFLAILHLLFCLYWFALPEEKRKPRNELKFLFYGLSFSCNIKSQRMGNKLSISQNIFLTEHGIRFFKQKYNFEQSPRN